MMADSVEILRPSEVPSRAADAVERLLEVASSAWKDEVELLRWYHDLPVWFVIEDGRSGAMTRVLQLTAVREAGQLWFEFAVHREMRGEEEIVMPFDEAHGGVTVERLPLDSRADALIETALRLWQSDYSFDGPDGTAPDHWEKIPLSSALRKRPS